MHVAQYKKFFLTEAQRKVKELEDTLLELERRPKDERILSALIIIVHALKGDAATMAYRMLADAMQMVENYFSEAQRGERTLSPTDLDRCFLLIDALRQSLASIDRNDSETDLAPAIEFMLAKPARRKNNTQGNAAPQKQSVKPHDSYAPLGTYIATSTESLDQTMTLVNELITYEQQAARAVRAHDSGNTTIAIHRIRTTLEELRAHVLMLKMIPVRQYFIFLGRLVRDIAREQRSFIRFVLEDNDLRLERHVLDAIRDVCLQLVKNATVHGYSATDKGTVTLSLSLKDEKLSITVADDGSGIDWDALASKAYAAKIISKEKLRAMPLDKRRQFLASAGISTRVTATMAAGRGVGLRTVLHAIDTLHGTIAFSNGTKKTQPGTIITITIPLPRTMYRALVFRWGAFHCAVPLFAIERIVQLPRMATSDTSIKIPGTNKKIPLLRVDECVFNGTVSHDETTYEFIALLRDSAHRTAALLIPRGSQEEELVVTSLTCLQRNPWISSVAVSEDSIPVTILNTDTIIAYAHARR